MSVTGKSILPSNWSWSKLGEVISEIQTGFACGKRDSDGYVQLRMNNIGLHGHLVLNSVLRVPKQLTKLEKYELRKGDILFNNTNSPELIGKSVLFNGEVDSCVYSNHITRLRAQEKLALPEWITWFLVREQQLGTFQRMCHRFVGQAGINRKDVLDLSIPIPPLLEQRRIISKIQKMFEEVRTCQQALQKVPTLMKEFRQSVLLKAFRGELTRQDSHDEPAAVLLNKIDRQRSKMETFADQSLPNLPNGWMWAPLDVLRRDDRPIIYGIIKPGPHVPNGIPYVRINEMESGTIDIAALRKTSKERAEKFKRATLNDGDILISKDGTIGKVAVVPPELQGGNITQHIVRVSVHPFVNRDYVVWAIRSPISQTWLNSVTKGIALRGVNVEDFRRLPIPLAPIEEQYRIVEKVAETSQYANRVEVTVSAILEKAQVIEQSILAKAFSGELVPQDPNDEPASVMLERIRNQTGLFPQEFRS